MKIMPEAKIFADSNTKTKEFDSLRLCGGPEDIREIIAEKLWDIPDLGIDLQCPIELSIERVNQPPANADEDMYAKQGYSLLVEREQINIEYMSQEGLINAFSTLKQMIEGSLGRYKCHCASVVDWPSIERRSLSVTYAWYAGYGRLGFDMQLWGFEEWKEFLRICSDYKINQLNFVLYGFWPFEFRDYPESVLRGIKMRVWNEESDNWVTVEYMHPNLDQEFLPQLIEYGHRLGISFFAYIGLNSYSGGYNCVHPQKRMKMPEGGNFINDFDSMCLSEPGNIEYIKAGIRRIIDQGFDGFDFEESEEAFWYCNCERCKETFWKGAATAEETLHAANTYLLKILYDEIRSVSPDCTIGIRAWRQPPLIRSDELIEQMVASIPEDIVLFWAPGQYVPEDEFEKWVKAFGKERIYARDTEAMGFAAGWGRLVRLFKWNGLRCEEESITQFIEEDIRQHRGSVQQRVKGINGYQFEWYGFFMAFFAHAYFGWGGSLDDEAFYLYALESVFGELAADIHYIMKNYLVIHESQLSVYKLEFPFARNKVCEADRPRIERAIAENPKLIAMVRAVRKRVKENGRLAHFDAHFKKWQVTLERSDVIYKMALISLALDSAGTAEERRALLGELFMLNEMDFDIIKRNYLDVNPIDQTGVKSCMFPYHEIKRSILNELYQEQFDDTPIYPGVEALGWLWA